LRDLDGLATADVVEIAAPTIAGRCDEGGSDRRVRGVARGARARSCAREKDRHSDVVFPRSRTSPPRAGVTYVGPTYDAAVGDVDGDGAVDVYVGDHNGGAVLLRNDGHGHFVDVVKAAGIEPGGDQHGSGLADYDNDGLLDLS
jgi:hypothetical protein